MKIGIIGAGKRFESIYFNILKKLGYEIYIWNRTIEKINKYKKHKVKIVENIFLFNNIKLDLCLSFIPPNISFDVLGDLNLNCPLLLETPVLDKRWINKSNVGVLEQWIHLPIEQFKEIIYKKEIIKRPYWVFNDGRSFNYHAIAQLRKYCNFSLPVDFHGKNLNINNKEGFIDKNKNLNYNNFEWLHGVSNLEGGQILSYSFAYNCKVTKLIPRQMLRAYSENGCIVSGRSYEMDNDYELFELRHLDKNKNVCIHKIESLINTKNKTIEKIFIKDLGIEWNNKYSGNVFSDQEIAIATMLEKACKGEIYTALQGFIDNYTIEAMKYSSYAGNAVSIKNENLHK